MPDRTDLIYRYDGTFDGFLCCVYESFRLKEQPGMILSNDEMQSMLFPDRPIASDMSIARRVAEGLRGRVGPDFLEFVEHAHLCALPGREVYLLALIRRGLREGPRVLEDLADAQVNRLYKAVLHLEREAHLYLGFVRFQVNEGALTAAIEPKNRVLPLMAAHFSDRYAAETFLIYDQVHREALIHQANGQARILPIDSLSLPDADEEEKRMRALWRSFFRTIAIRERENPLCQRNHMPKRYWAQMTEHQIEPDASAFTLAPPRAANG